MGLFDILASTKSVNLEKLPDTVLIEASLNVDAHEGDETKRPTFTLEANSGIQPMSLGGFPHPVIVDLKGAAFSKDKTPVIMEHDFNRRLGHTTSQSIDAAGIHAAGEVSSDSQDAKNWVSDSKNGFPFEVSIGAKVLKAALLPAGKKATVNGREFTGPLIIAQQSSIYELTVTLVGADRNTSASVAASFSSLSGDLEMKYADWLKANNFPPEEEHEAAGIKASLRALFDKGEGRKPEGQETQAGNTTLQASGANGGDNLQAIDLSAERKARAAEELRCSQINGFAKKYSDQVTTIKLEDGKEMGMDEFKAHAIGENMDVRDFELAIIRAARPAPVGPAIHITPDIEGDVYGEAIACSLAKSWGMKSSFKGIDGNEYGYEHQFSEQALNASDDRRIKRMSLHKMMGITIQASGASGFLGAMGGDELIGAYEKATRNIQASGPFSTLTVTNILEDAGNKFLLQRFMLKPAMWPRIARTRSVTDFKAHKLYRMAENMGYLKVGSTGELKHGSLSDTKRTIQAETYGRMFGLSRQDIINDDLEAFRQILIGLADGASWAIESEVFGLLLTMINSGTFFTAQRGNLITNDLTIAGLTAAEQAFMDQVGDEGKPLMFMPDRLVVGTQDSVLASQLNTDLTVISTTTNNGFENNPHRGKYGTVATGYLNNTNLRKPDGSEFVAQDSDQWLMISDPDDLALIEVALLNGRAVPTIESADSSFDTLGRQMRGYHDFGVAEGDYQAGVLSTGDDSSG